MLWLSIAKSTFLECNEPIIPHTSGWVGGFVGGFVGGWVDWAGGWVGEGVCVRLFVYLFICLFVCLFVLWRVCESPRVVLCECVCAEGWGRC